MSEINNLNVDLETRHRIARTNPVLSSMLAAEEAGAINRCILRMTRAMNGAPDQLKGLYKNAITLLEIERDKAADEVVVAWRKVVDVDAAFKKEKYKRG